MQVGRLLPPALTKQKGIPGMKLNQSQILISPSDISFLLSEFNYVFMNLHFSK